MLITDASKLKDFASDRRVWQGIPGIARTPRGRIFVSFYSGDTKETFGNFAALIRSDDELRYSEPIAVACKSGAFRCFDPVLWIDPLKRLWFIWNVMPGEEVWGALCEDPDADEPVWSREFYIGRGVMMNKPTVLSTGEWLFPIAIWKPDLLANLRRRGLTEEDVAASYVYKTSDNGHSFHRLGGADVPNRSYDEHMVYEMNNGVLRMLVRLNRGIGESYSYDRGHQWSCGRKLSLCGPSSRFYVGKLPSGRVLLINHATSDTRSHLTAYLSEDDGMTFPYSLLLDSRKSISYPDVTVGEGGVIHVVYDRERGCFLSGLEEAYASAREILVARITEDEILCGALSAPESYLCRVVCKLSRLAEGIPNPYRTVTGGCETLAQELLDDPDTDPIEALFERFPPNCVAPYTQDFKKLDALIAQFEASERRDRTILQAIIERLTSAPEPAKSAPIYTRICEYVEEHLSEDIPISQIARDLHLSVYYLSHVFKSETGTTVTEYRNELRMTRAKLLLKNTDLRISQIACEVGFGSASYFTETFTRTERISPQKYRNLHKEV